METAATKIARLNRSIARTGETVTLRRTVENTDTGAVSTVEEIVCPAHIRDSAPQNLAGGEDVVESRVILSATSLAQTIGSPAFAFGIPNKDDLAVIHDRVSRIERIQPLYWGGQLIRVNMWCRGSGG